MTEVVVTGIGAVTCHGYGAAELWRSMCSAVSKPPDRPADPLAHMDLPLIYLVPDRAPGRPSSRGGDNGAGGTNGSDGRSGTNGSDGRSGTAASGGSGGSADGTGRASGFAIAAVSEALRDAGLPAAGPGGERPPRMGLVIGSCMGEVEVCERGRSRTGASWNPPFQVASQVGDWLGAFGPNGSVANACAAGGFSVSMAADMISQGEADIVIAGGADAYSRVALACFNRLGAVDPIRCRPFDLNRRGTVFAEGAGMLVLESAGHAADRGARPYARIAGSGWSCDAHHPTAPEPDGRQVARAAREALDQAGRSGGVGCVIPHGTGTRLNDVVESNALRDVLGPGHAEVPLYSLKALIGHTGGAAAALAACAGAMVLRHGRVPANVSVEEQDPECGVFLPQSGDVPLRHPRILVNGFGFGGNNCSVVLEAAA